MPDGIPDAQDAGIGAVDYFQKCFFSREEEYEFVIRHTINSGQQGAWDSPLRPSFGLYEVELDSLGGGPCAWAHVHVNTDHTTTLFKPEILRAVGGYEEIGFIIGAELRNRIYRFDAERLNRGQCKHGDSQIKPTSSYRTGPL